MKIKNVILIYKRSKSSWTVSKQKRLVVKMSELFITLALYKCVNLLNKIWSSVLALLLCDIIIQHYFTRKLIYQGFPRRKHPLLLLSTSFAGRIGLGNLKSSCTQFYRLLRWKWPILFSKTSQNEWLFYINVPRDVQELNSPLFNESKVGNVGRKAVKLFTTILQEISGSFILLYQGWDQRDARVLFSAKLVERILFFSKDQPAV